jgi:hypothetical protein
MKLRYPSNLLKLPNLRQATNYSCGACALQSVLIYYGKYEDSELELAKELNTSPEWGTEPEDIVRVAKHYGLEAEIKTGLTIDDLDFCVNSQRIPVIIAYQAWSESALSWEVLWEDGHYSIVVGLDKHNVYLEDPSLAGSIGYIPIAEFLERWHDIDANDNPLNQLGIPIAGPYPIHVGRLQRID